MSDLAGAAEGSAVETGKRSMTVRGAAFLGVGSMVGAGIFALREVLGLIATGGRRRAPAGEPRREVRVVGVDVFHRRHEFGPVIAFVT